jgi:hypothetical protein
MTTRLSKILSGQSLSCADHVESSAEKAGVGQTTAVVRYGGKSGLPRTGRQVTPGGREPTESATENIPPAWQVRVKWCGKSAPRDWQQFAAR